MFRSLRKAALYHGIIYNKIKKYLKMIVMKSFGARPETDSFYLGFYWIARSLTINLLSTCLIEKYTEASLILL